MRARLLVWSAAMSALACLSSPGLPAWAASEPARSLDDELLDSLGADPIDEFDRELFAPDDQALRALSCTDCNLTAGDQPPDPSPADPRTALPRPGQEAA